MLVLVLVLVLCVVFCGARSIRIGVGRWSSGGNRMRPCWDVLEVRGWGVVGDEGGRDGGRAEGRAGGCVGVVVVSETVESEVEGVEAVESVEEEVGSDSDSDSDSDSEDREGRGVWEDDERGRWVVRRGDDVSRSSSSFHHSI